MTTVKRQLAMVMDLNKCLGCHTCTVACKTLWTSDKGMDHMWFNTVNTVPGKGTPKGWEGMGGGFDARGEALPGHRPSKKEFGEAWRFNHDEAYAGGRGDASHLTFQGGKAPDWGPNWDEDQGGGEYPNAYYFYLPRICNHCTHPACQEACPRKAIEKREDNGIVLVNEDRCRGYRFCQEACPYKKIYFNELRGVSQKCIFCFPRIEKGVATACARQCPGRLRFVGYLDDPKGPIHKLVHEYQVALPLHAEYGTQPNVFYVPPLSPEEYDSEGRLTGRMRIPLAYLEGLFGKRVGDALAMLQAERERSRRGERSELMDLLIARDWHSLFGPLNRDPRSIGERGTG